ncbi:DOPA 4,5-dioxygenase family protein [Marinomonas ostreistagni]|uniref:DOPA 4,5-dioxygenase family protein n=1 Tax=Marinomonas ostreistagni TaxID=359209 RepID=UPI00194E36C1|nr:DOPA 4,5-dioxygenase family protein [Marinomonas ostreistagni]MBM6549615.1 DOPA 4,5-dioxygenase family protein [Marinomonas ostreistagni]
MNTADIQFYHAHIYYDDEAGLAQAQQLAAQIEQQFEVKVGRFHQKKVGPHPKWSVQISFAAPEFAQVIPWLMLNRGDLDVFYHPLTGDELFDHTQGVAWLGNAHDLDIRQFLTKN